MKYGQPVLGKCNTIDKWVALVFCSIALSSCTQKTNKLHPLKLMHQNHPLVGKVWDGKQQKFIGQPQLLTAIIESEYLLLGETHDNSEHHQHQAWVIDQLSNKKIKAGIAFEMISNKQAQLIDNDKLISTDELFRKLTTHKSGWKYREYYMPVFESSIRAKYPLYAANLDRQSLLTIISKGKEALPVELANQLADTPLPEHQITSLRKDIIESHCGMSKPEMVDAMLLGQRIRDVTMSNSLYRNKNQNTTTMVLIAGSGHVRKDRGVPYYLKKRGPQARITSIAWIEVDKDAHDISDYSEHIGKNATRFDYIWFTAQADRPDPCEKMKRFMQRHKTK